MTLVPPRGTRPHPHESGSNAFADFYHATAGPIMRTACRMTAGDRELAEDAVQEALLVVWRDWPRRHRLSHCDNRNYVLGIAANKIAGWYRKQDLLVELDGDMAVCTLEEDLVEKLDMIAVLGEARELIAIQPPRRRLVASMHFLEAMSYAEIAETLGIAESTARTQVERYRDQLEPLTRRFTDTNRGGELS